MANINYFLKMDGIKGESKHAPYLGEIELLTFGHSDTQSGSAVGGSGRAGGKVSLHNLYFTKYTDSTSAVLVQACASGQHIPAAVLTARRTEGTEDKGFVRFIMEDVIISSVNSSSGAGSKAPTDSVAINFGKGTYEYNTAKPAPAPSAPPKKKGP